MTNNLEVVQGKVFDVIGVADAVIAQMAEKYLPLKINGIDDKPGYKAVHEARMVVKNTRVKVEKHGKEMREDAVKYQKAVIAEEKRIVALMEPIEAHLSAEEKAIDDALEAIKQEAARKEAERIQKRIERLEGYGMGLIGGIYKLPFDAPGTEFPAVLVKTCTDEQYEKFCTAIQEVKDKEVARLAKIEADRKAEEERLAKIAAEQAAERQLLEIARIEQEEAAKKLREEQAAIEVEKKRLADAEAARLRAIEDEKIRIENEKKRQAELEQAKKEAAEKALRDAEEKAKREAKEKADREERERIAAEKKAARQPDKVKILTWVSTFNDTNNPTPCLKTDEAKEIVRIAKEYIEKILQGVKGEAEAL